MISTLLPPSQTNRSGHEHPAPSAEHGDGEAAPERVAHWSVPELRARGWTEAMVQHLLGEPDQRVVNPYYRTAAPMRLYRAARVLAAEHSPSFAERAAKAAARSARAKAIADHKAQALLDQVAVMSVLARRLAPDAVQQRAIAS